eukprot:7791948-Karenia_brevis.AAC.1
MAQMQEGTMAPKRKSKKTHSHNCKGLPRDATFLKFCKVHPFPRKFSDHTRNLEVWRHKPKGDNGTLKDFSLVFSNVYNNPAKDKRSLVSCWTEKDKASGTKQAPARIDWHVNNPLTGKKCRLASLALQIKKQWSSEKMGE